MSPRMAIVLAVVITAIVSVSGTLAIAPQLISLGPQVQVVRHGAASNIIHPADSVEPGRPFLRDAGVIIERYDLPGYPRVIQALASKSVDVGEVGLEQVAAATQKGANFKVIGVSRPSQEWVLTVPVGVNTIQELRGKKLAVHGIGTSTDLTAKFLLRKVGMTDKDVEYLVVPGSENRRQAMLAGKIDATVIGLFDALQLIQTGKYKVLGSLQDVEPGIISSVFVADAEWLTKNRDLSKKYMKGIILGFRMVHDDPERWVSITKNTAPGFPDAAYPVIRTEYLKIGFWPVNGDLTRENVDRAIKFYRDIKAITGDFNPDAVIDYKIVEDALREIGRR